MVYMDEKEIKDALASLPRSKVRHLLPDGWVHVDDLATHRMLYEEFFEPYGLTKQLLSARFRRGIYDIEPVLSCPGATLYDRLEFKAMHEEYERRLRGLTGTKGE